MTSAPPLFLVGATAVGKSAIALELADRLGGEIISVDSMQVYRGLDIGTAKPSPAERSRIPHHLIDVVDFTSSFDVAQFIRLARSAQLDIQKRGRLPIFCGGTGLYLKAFLHGLGETPGTDPGLRAELEGWPTDILLNELERTDPMLFQTIDRHNRRRLVRAIEVIRLTGKPYSAQRSRWPRQGVEPSGQLFGVQRNLDDSRQRINDRVDVMFSGGILRETQELMQRRLVSNPTASHALGYRQVIEHLSGQRSLEETIDLVKQRTRQFAKRQGTWFRNQLPMRWIDLSPAEAPDESAARIIAVYHSSRPDAANP